MRASIATRVIAAALTLMTPMLHGCTSAKPQRITVADEAARVQPAARPARISHLVFITLLDAGDADALLRDCDASLATIPGVLAYAGGLHLDTGRGERVDSAYHVGLYIGFETEADYSTYVAHPNHTGLLERWQPRIARLRVFDVLDGTR